MWIKQMPPARIWKQLNPEMTVQWEYLPAFYTDRSDGGELYMAMQQISGTVRAGIQLFLAPKTETLLTYRSLMTF